MHIKGLGLGGLLAIVGLVGCGSSGGTGGTGGSTGGGGLTGSAGTTGGAGKGGSTGSGGSTGTGGGTFTTSVPGATKLTGLSSAQVTQFCADGEAFIKNTYIPTLCSAFTPIEGVEAGYLYLQDNPNATNAQIEAACAREDADAGTCLFAVNPDGGSCDIGSIPSTCQATVADYTKCINDTTTVDRQFVSTIPSCSSLTAASVSAYLATDGGGQIGPQEPTECAVFDSGGACSTDTTEAMLKMSAKMMRKP
jgi:hypothetical protein